MNKIEILNSVRIKPLIESGIVKKIDSIYSKEFDEYLCKAYPWERYSGRIDWKNVKKPYKRFKWDTATVQETTEFLNATCLKNYSEICVIYEPNLPALVGKYDYVCEELENLTIFGWTTRFLVGVRRDQFNVIHLDYECFVEVDFSDWLTASC